MTGLRLPKRHIVAPEEAFTRWNQVYKLKRWFEQEQADGIRTRNLPLVVTVFHEKLPLVVCAANEGRFDALEYLLMLGNESDQRYKDLTALFHAGSNGHSKCVKLLLDQKADPNATETITGDTPLHYVLSSWDEKRISCVKLLCEAKADITKQNLKGHTPLDNLESSKDKQQAALNSILEKANRPSESKSVNSATPTAAPAPSGFSLVKRLFSYLGRSQTAAPGPSSAAEMRRKFQNLGKKVS